MKHQVSAQNIQKSEMLKQVFCHNIATIKITYSNYGPGLRVGMKDTTTTEARIAELYSL